MNNAIKHFTASALIIDNDKVLLVFHKKFNVWLYPGGHVEKNENPDETLLREVKEETGLEVEIISFCWRVCVCRNSAYNKSTI